MRHKGHDTLGSQLVQVYYGVTFVAGYSRPSALTISVLFVATSGSDRILHLKRQKMEFHFTAQFGNTILMLE
jgi:hypothetical protein